jgi:hypothetical protein
MNAPLFRDFARLHDSDAGGFGPGRLRSLWDMLELDAANFVHLLHLIGNSEETARANPGEIPEAYREAFCELPSEKMKELCNWLNLPVSAVITKYVRSARTGEALSAAYIGVKRSIHSELSGRIFFEPDAKYKKYFRNDKPFGGDVFEAFSSANEDIIEAANCLALERATACVLHLMRVVEAGLAALAAAIGVGKQNDWGGYLREITKELETRKRNSGARTADEQFYAEVADTIDHMKRAYRNPTMHPEKSYSQDRAEEIFVSVRSFMRHLVTKIRE